MRDAGRQRLSSRARVSVAAGAILSSMVRTNPAAVAPVITDALRRIVGPDGLIADPDELTVYEFDGYTLQKRLPQLVVLPRTPEEVVSVVRLCWENRLPIIPRGAGTSLSGAVLAVDGGVMIAPTRMNRVLEID